ncbi:MAG: FAD-binding protein [Actinobacteria bacterium]|nr:FAD-binding protein [Actinomycetota bacterium]
MASVSGTVLVAFLIVRRDALATSVAPVADVLKVIALWCLLFVLLPLSVRRTLGTTKVHTSLPLVAAGLLLVSVDAVVVVDPQGPGDLGRLVGFGGLAMLAVGFVSFALGLGLVPAIIVHPNTRRFLVWWLYGTLVFPVALFHAVLRRIRPTTTSSARKHRTRALVVLVPLLLYATATLRNRFLLYTSPPSDDQYCLAQPSSSTAGAPEHIANVPRTLRLVQEGGTINDASCLNETGIFGIVRPTTIEDLRQTLAFARAKGLRASIAGARHSMGGQSFVKNGLVVDMTALHQMTVDPKRNVLTVQSGATWKEVQDFLHPRGLSVKAMQSVNPLTVGGTIAVNAHGIDHRVGTIESSIRSLRVMLSDGTLVTLSRQQEPELFRSIVGGYGLLGVIVEADIEVTVNEMYELERRVIDYREVPDLFETTIAGDDRYKLLYGHLSTAPHNFLREMLLYTYRSADRPEVSIPPLREAGYVEVSRLTFNIGKAGPLGRWTKWMVEKYVLPHVRPCYESRNQALTAPEACLISRNQAMYSSTDALKSSLKRRTEILQEYFVPRHRLVEFVDGLRGALADKKADLLNASLRVVHKDDLVLGYAKDDVFAVVLYFSQRTGAEGNADMGRLTRQLIDFAGSLGGTFYLPYQLHYTKQQIRAAYPELDVFLELKAKYDPSGVFSNRLYEKYFG